MDSSEAAYYYIAFILTCENIITYHIKSNCGGSFLGKMIDSSTDAWKCDTCQFILAENRIASEGLYGLVLTSEPTFTKCGLMNPTFFCNTETSNACR